MVYKVLWGAICSQSKQKHWVQSLLFTISTQCALHNTRKVQLYIIMVKISCNNVFKTHTLLFIDTKTQSLVFLSTRPGHALWWFVLVLM